MLRAGRKEFLSEVRILGFKRYFGYSKELKKCNSGRNSSQIANGILPKATREGILTDGERKKGDTDGKIVKMEISIDHLPQGIWKMIGNLMPI